MRERMRGREKLREGQKGCVCVKGEMYRDRDKSRVRD